MVKISFSFNRKEFVESYLSDSQQKWTLLFILLIGIVFTLLGSYHFVKVGFTNGEFLPPFYFAFGAVMIWIYFFKRNSFGRIYDANPSLSEPINYAFANHNFKVSGNQFNSKVAWDSIHQVTENTNFIYIYITRGIIYIIPKRAFTSKQLMTFKQIIRQQKDLKQQLLE